VCVSAPNVEVTVTEKTTSVKKEKVTTVGDQEVRVVESSPTFTETLPPVTEVNEGDQVRSVICSSSGSSIISSGSNKERQLIYFLAS